MIIVNEQRGFSPSKRPPKNIKNILSQIELFEMYPGIFALVIKNDRLRARVFMRYQEFYESDSDSFRGKGFKWNDFVKFYKKKTKKDYFSYHEDWAGYNIPCNSIESCAALIPDLNFYDLIMFSVVDTIRKKVGSENFYLIGIDQSNGEDPSLIFHEMAHGLWFANPSYKKEMSTIINEAGYGDNVYEDELQAYLSTGVDGSMRRIKDIKPEIFKFTQAFEKYSKKIKPKRIPIDWSTDLDR